LPSVCACSVAASPPALYPQPSPSAALELIASECQRVDASEIEHVDERDTGDERTGAWRRRGRHAAPSPAPLRSLALTAQQVTLLALAVAAVVALAAWWVIRAAPSAEPVQLAQERVVPTLPAADPVASAAWPNDGATPQPTSAAASTALAGTVVVVDVAGKVRHPGIVELPQGSRVVDALREAGGARAGVDTSALNLAASW
jgi:competence protein ComEA